MIDNLGNNISQRMGMELTEPWILYSSMAMENTCITGWWLTNPSEKYESQLG